MITWKRDMALSNYWLLSLPSRTLLAGSSQSGKTTRLFRIIEQAEFLYGDATSFKNVYYFYSKWNKTLEKNKHLVCQFINECPLVEQLEKLAIRHIEEGSVMVIDDYGTELTADIIKAFTVSSSNLNMSIFLMTQNLYMTPWLRTVRLNCTELYVFKNPNDPTQIRHLGLQIRPENYQEVVQAYQFATKDSPYSYLHVNFRRDLPEEYRLGSHLGLDEERPRQVYVSVEAFK